MTNVDSAIGMEVQRPLCVLYLHHVGPFGGASRSLMEMIAGFPVGSVDPRVLLPSGQVAEILAARGIAVSVCGGVAQFDNCAYSYYRGFRWFVLLRELLLLPTTAVGLWRARRAWPDVDLVHVNEITMLPSLVLARLIFPGVPIVIHVRSVQRQAGTARNRLLNYCLKRMANAIVAIDQTVRRSLPGSLDVAVIHNGLRVPEANADVQDRDSRFTVAMVGSISRVKGCVEFVKAAALCKMRGLDIRFVMVGQPVRQRQGIRDWLIGKLGVSQNIDDELSKLIDAHDLSRSVEFWPFTTDLRAVYGRIDAVCFPSHFDAPGRPIFEAAFYAVPAIAAISAPTPDTIIDGQTGITIEPRSAVKLADAIASLCMDRERCRRMGRAALANALANFDARRNAERILALYRKMLAQDGRSRAK